MALRRLLNLFTPSQPEPATPSLAQDGKRDYEMERRRMEEELRTMQLEHEQQMREILELTRCDEEKRKREEGERRREHERRMSEMVEGASRDAKKRQRDEEFVYCIENKAAHLEEKSVHFAEARILADREVRRREMEEIKMKDEEENEERDRMRREEKRRWDEEQRALDEERDQSRKNFDEASNTIREQRDEELHRIALEREADREEFEEKLRCERERIAQSHEELSNRFRTQMAELYKRMQFGLWTKYIEAQWANRLEALRDAYTPSRRLFHEIQWDLSTLIEQQGLNRIIERSAITMKLALLREELAMLIEIMVNEVGEMQKFARERPNAKFLAHIEKCAANVAETVTNLHSSIEEIETRLNSDLVIQISIDLLNESMRKSQELEKSVKSIPTIMELKERYGNQ
ncbi:hypothetical protein PRIPAC_83940 [Pristionchus pacificus]|uniref:Uncharacterized protein n=1 Tax=Pristionchus pacificus TaxID=54126 RepID=A0A2A6BUK1_PRIPA|nr:hypothetical protein PRIPAC_83940 [Pristionchus pacificus]|eukprot:PDM69652.1 hypothetical protein PRIPAC_44748 [Pristionchus pacificus]